MSNSIVLISIVEGDYSKHKHVLYIYNFRDNQYVGYIKTSDLLNLPIYEGRKICAIDYSINQAADQITIVAKKQAFLLSK